MPEATVIIPTYNRSKALKGTLDSLAEMLTSIDYQIIVVDDSDEDKSKKICGKHELDINYIRPEESKNLPHARNVGWKNTDSDIVAFVDDDVRFKDNWLDAIVNSFKSNENVGAVGGPALEFEEGETKNKMIKKNQNQNVVTEKGFVEDNSTRWMPKDPAVTDTLRGANMAFRKSALQNIGGFDTGYIGNCFREDTDICVRIRHQGYKIIYNPKAKLEHLYLEEGGTRGKDKDFWYSLGFNQRRFIEKNFRSYLARHFAKFFLTWAYSPYSFSKLILSSIKNLEPSRLALIRGYFRL